MIITETIVLTWRGINRKYYEDKGYIYTKIDDKFIVNVKDLPDNCNSEIQVRCDICGKVHNTSFKYYIKTLRDNLHYCHSCVWKLFSADQIRLNKLEKGTSFGKWCENNLSISECKETLDRWDYSKNQCSPYDVSFTSNLNGGYYFKCGCNIHESEKKNLKAFVKGKRKSIFCNACNSLFCKRPDLLKYIKNIEDSKKYSYGSGDKINTICPLCGYERPYRICKLSTGNFSCPKCGDGVSYPSKVFFNVLEQLKQTFKCEYSPIFAEGRRYDFYFKTNGDKEHIVEIDGGYHYIGNPRTGQTREDIKLIDDEKEKLAKEHDIDVIRIDSQESNISYMKNSIFDSDFSKLFDLSNINWDECNENALSSLVKKACELWNEYKSVIKVSEIIQLSETTIRKYLKRGTEIGFCNYIPKYNIKCKR